MNENRRSDAGGLAPTRRTLLKAFGAGVGLMGLGTSVGSAQSSESWSIVALPDTQRYAINYVTSDDPSEPNYARDQTEWIAENVGSENIAFVSHLGDVVQRAFIGQEWEYMDDAMSVLDGVVPYSTVPGNHDWTTNFDRSSSTANYEQYFGPSRHSGRDYFGGSGPDNLSTYQFFSGGGYDFLHLALEWEAPGNVSSSSTALGWAQDVLDQYPDTPTILTTHSYLRDEPKGRPEESQEEDKDGNPGQDIWEKLVAPNSQIFMVLCGHWFEDDGETYQVSTNDDGQEVYELLSDYQARGGKGVGGYGLLRHMKFRPGAGEDAPDRIDVRTYTPSRDEYETDGDSRFSFDLDFAARFSGESSGTPEEPEEPGTAFQQGTDGYDGTVDTTLSEANPGTANGSDGTMTVDSDTPSNSGNASQGLLRFDGIVGGGDDQIPSNAAIQSASLTLDISGEGDGAALHRMITDWDDADTWNSVGGGVQTGTDALSSADAQTGAVDTGTVTVDVTQSVQAWANGEPNFGWVLEPAGGDGFDIKTAESDSPPKLVVEYDGTSGGGDDVLRGDADGDGDVDGDDVSRIQDAIAGEDVTVADGADVNGDGDVDIGDAISARNISEGSR